MLLNNGLAPPLPWDIPVQPKEIFEKEIFKLEVPNTAHVKVLVQGNCFKLLKYK